MTETPVNADGTRERWLTRAADLLLAEVLAPVNIGVVPEYVISVGFPKGRHGKGRAVGQCWSPKLAKDGKAHIFVSPERDGTEATAVLATVLHELIHAADGCEHGHKGPFAKMATAVGLLKPLTCSTPDEPLASRLNAVAARLGPYPHGALTPIEGARRPGSRLRLWECACGIKARVASDDFNATCGECDEAFEQKGDPS